MTQTRGRNPGFGGKFRSRSAGISGPNPNRRIQAGGAGWTSQHGDDPSLTSTRRPASYLARLRSRSGSSSRPANRRRATRTQQLDDEAGASIDASDQAASSQVEDMIERHQLALKMDMLDLLGKHEKEIKFWKNKALKLKKKISQETPEASAAAGEQNPVGNGNALQLQQALSEDATGSEQGLVAERVTMLEKEVENRDILIDSLRKTMEIQDKANEERVQLLEGQLERLVEMKTPAPASAASSPPRLLSEFNNARRGSDAGRSNSGGEGGNEVAVLEQLLARVLAEKDKLLFENQNLRSILRESELLPPENGSVSNSKKGRDGLREDRATTVGRDGAGSKYKLPGQEYEYFRVLYQMSCKISPKNHRHIKYTGSCDGNVADTQQALKRIMEQHFSQVWTIVQEEGGSVSSSVRAEELAKNDSNDPVDFSTSSLARHVANHCQSFSSEREVVQWCRENIKVEIQQGLDGKLGSSKKRERSKSKRKNGDSQGARRSDSRAGSRSASRAGSRQSEGSF